MRKTMTILGVLVVTAAVLGSAGGCQPETRDYEGAQLRDPDEVVIYSNVDGHPNLVRQCLDGVGFVTTTRDYEPVLRIPEWDDYCLSIDIPNANDGRSGDSGLDPDVAP